MTPPLLEFGEVAHGLQILEHLGGLVFVHRGDGEADVHQHVVAQPRVRHIAQVDALLDTGEVNLA
jgi:hypothetical protein